MISLNHASGRVTLNVEPCPSGIIGITNPDSSLQVEVHATFVAAGATTSVAYLASLTASSLASINVLALVALPVAVVSLIGALLFLYLLVSTI